MARRKHRSRKHRSNLHPLHAPTPQPSGNPPPNASHAPERTPAPSQAPPAHQPPADRAQLRLWLQRHLGIEVPDRPFVQGNATPLDYLAHAFLEPRRTDAAHDCVVWANRGGGKTFMGAVATALDLAFKPGIEVRILAGSVEQGQRMHEHLRKLFEIDCLASLLDSRITARRVTLANGSRCELLAQSQASVRGTRVQKLRCDEVELFDPEVWEAAQLVTRSRHCDTVLVRGAVEAFSTMHVPFGLMSRIVADARDAGRTIFRWSVLDVLKSADSREAIPPGLADDELFAPRGPDQQGHMTLADALAMKRRVSAETWESEMLCRRPSRCDAVYPEFNPHLHVIDELPAPARTWRWVAGMDFGYRAPTVVLWATISPDDVLFVADERVVDRVILDEHARAIAAAPWPRPEMLAIDPAGLSRNSQTGLSDAEVLRRAGFRLGQLRRPTVDGLRLVRARIAPASGQPRLYVHRRCTRLIESLVKYHYDPSRPGDPEPVKDGNDHAADALRYLVQNLDARFKTAAGDYLAADCMGGGA